MHSVPDMERFMKMVSHGMFFLKYNWSITGRRIRLVRIQPGWFFQKECSSALYNTRFGNQWLKLGQ